jgi:hypothetical protein
MSLPAVAQDQPPLQISKTGPSWVERSNAYAQVLIRAEASFRPEAFSEFGIPDYDDQTVDLGADNAKRFRRPSPVPSPNCTMSCRSSMIPMCA